MYFFIQNDKFCLSVSIISGLLLLYKIGRLVYFKDKKYFNFGSLLLISAIGFKFFGLLQVLIYADSLETWPFVITDSVSLTIAQRVLCVLIGEWLSVIGSLLISLTWFHFGGVELADKINIPIAGKKAKRPYWVLYFAALSLEFGLRYLPGLNLYILILTLYFGALFAVIIICDLYKKDLKQHRLLLAIILLLPYLFNSFQTGMKEAMVISLLPVMVDFYYRFSTVAQKVVLALLASFVFIIFSIFSNVTRAIAWGNTRSVSFIELVNNFNSQLKYIQADFIYANLEQVLKRVTPLFYQGWTVSLQYTDEKLSGLFTNVFTLLIPRFLWSAKPLNNPEYEMTVIFYGPTIAESTSEASGLFSEIYIKEGILFFFPTCIFLGWIINRLQKISLRYGNDMTAKIFNFILIFSSLRFHELYFTSIFPGFLIKCVYIFTYCFFINLFFQKRTKLSLTRPLL